MRKAPEGYELMKGAMIARNEAGEITAVRLPAAVWKALAGMGALTDRGHSTIMVRGFYEGTGGDSLEEIGEPDMKKQFVGFSLDEMLDPEDVGGYKRGTWEVWP